MKGTSLIIRKARGGHLCDMDFIFIDHVALAKQGDNGIGSVRMSACLSVQPSVCVSNSLRSLMY